MERDCPNGYVIKSEAKCDKHDSHEMDNKICFVYRLILSVYNALGIMTF